jgi:hypothetical protein
MLTIIRIGQNAGNRKPLRIGEPGETISGIVFSKPEAPSKQNSHPTFQGF